MEELTAAEREKLKESILPVSHALVKVWKREAYQQLQKVSFAMINSTTILLPAWKELLEDLELKVKLMPRDVHMRWNSTHAMLSFLLEYWTAIEHITSERKNKLQWFELSKEEWDIARELSDTLKVGPCGSTFATSHTLAMYQCSALILVLFPLHPDPQGCNRIFFVSNT